MNGSSQHFFASCPTGLEGPLGEELQTLGATGLQATRGGVAFTGPFHLSYRVNLESRMASRVLWRVFRGGYGTERDVQDAAYRLSWADWFAVTNTIKVKVSARSCPLKSLDFVTLKIKDAICDKFRDQAGRRPVVETKGPDIRVEAFLDATHLTLYVDTSGEALFKRGYRKSGGEAPLRENLAAGLVRLSGWTPDQPLLDPMCGGGTILIEAAHLARKIPPGLGRRFAFEKLSWFNQDAWQGVCEAARANQRPDLPVQIFGSDLFGAALQGARDNLAAAGLAEVVPLKQVDLLSLTPPAPEGILLTNPPYGVRMGAEADLAELYPRLGTVLKQRFAGWRAYIFTAELRLPGLIRLAESRRTPLFNGALECRLFEFKMVAGSMRRTKSPLA